MPRHRVLTVGTWEGSGRVGMPSRLMKCRVSVLLRVNGGEMSGEQLTSAGRGQEQERPWWQRPTSWIGGIIAAAAAGTLTAALSGVFGGWLEQATQTGPAVSVDSVATYRSDATGDSVVFPEGTDFSEADLNELNSVEDDVAWLEARGGVAVSTVYISMALSGNRSDPVRITDITASTQCEEPLKGLRFENPPAGADDSISVSFNLDDANPTALFSNPEGDLESFFPARTISLMEGEQQVVLIDASTQEQYCEFAIELHVLEGDQTKVQEVRQADDTHFAVTASVPDSEYEDIYLGGVICPTWVKAGPAYFDGDFENYCSG